MNDPFQKRPAPALVAALVFVGILTAALMPWSGRDLPRPPANDDVEPGAIEPGAAEPGATTSGAAEPVARTGRSALPPFPDHEPINETL